MVVISPGDDVQAIIDAHPAGTRFLIKTGIHTTSAPIQPRDGDAFIGEEGAVFAGGELLEPVRNRISDPSSAPNV